MLSKKWVLLLALFLTVGMPLTTVKAARGVPGSSEFGFGSHLALNGSLIDPALEMAGSLPLDWICVDFAWSAYYPSAEAKPDWSPLDKVISYAANHQVAVMLSVSDAPGWAVTPAGPDPQQVGQLVARLLKRYGGSLQAVELFPGANTPSGWGAAPNAGAYAAVAAAVRSQLAQAGSPALLVLAGLTPVANGANDGSIDDLLFLQSLYDAGVQQFGDVLSLQMNNLTGDPLFAPDGQEHRILRHYEEVRQVMLNNGHEKGLVWVTRFLAPCGTINQADQRYQKSEEQLAWLVQAYTQLRAQLYIGAVFYDALNPGRANSCSNQGRTLVLNSSQYYAFYPKLRDLIAENAPETMLSRRGRPKSGEFIKSRP